MLDQSKYKYCQMFHPSCCLACNQNLVFLCTSTVSRKWLLSQRPTCARRLFATHPHPPTCASSVRHYTTPNCSSWALTAGNATLCPRILPPLIIWTEKHDRPNDTHHASWHSGNEFEEPIYKHIGKHCSDGGGFFLKSKYEIVTRPDKHREPISLMIDISQKLADKMRDNPDKVKALLFDLPLPYGCRWAYDLLSHASLARFQWFPESTTPLDGSWAVRYIKDKKSCSIM